MHISLKLPSQLEVVPDFLITLEEKLEELSLEKKDIFDIKLCLNEALVNAIKHGNKFNPKLYVAVDIEGDHRRLTVSVEDEGQGFDFNNVPDPTKPDKLEGKSGRGVFLIKKLMDEVDFFDCGRRIRMVKFFK